MDSGWGRNAPDGEYLKRVFDRTEKLIEDRWGIPVIIQDVPNPFTGDLDGQRIMVDFDLDVHEAVFILIHLFGHTVQWNVSETNRALALAKPAAWTDELLAAVVAYEEEACRYSLQLVHEAGFRDLDQWLSDFSACDSAYLMHFYKTGEKRPFRQFWTDDAPLMSPLAIPPFQPERWISRYDGTVV
jgi:hypothetical protein